MELIKSNNGYITTKELANLKINRYFLSEMEKEGILERIKRGVYRSTEEVLENEIIEVSKLIPNGVFCLETALEYYDLSTNAPYEYKIAIPMKSRVIIPEYPPIKIIYFPDKTYNLGISEKEIDGNIIKIYDMEKTICDIARYRNKIGQDIFTESLKEYMKKTDRNIKKLIEYSKITNTYNILKDYLEVLI